MRLGFAISDGGKVKRPFSKMNSAGGVWLLGQNFNKTNGVDIVMFVAIMMQIFRLMVHCSLTVTSMMIIQMGLIGWGVMSRHTEDWRIPLRCLAL